MPRGFATVPFQIEVEVYRFYKGSIPSLVPRILEGKENGRTVDHRRHFLTPKQFMELRLGRRGGDLDAKVARNTPVHIGLALPHPGRDELKFAPYNNDLFYSLNTEMPLVNGNLPITVDQYEAIEGFVFASGEVAKLRYNRYDLEPRRKEFWEYVVEGDLTLLRNYIDYVDETAGMPFRNIMGICPHNKKGAHLWRVDIAWHGKRSDADASDVLDLVYSCLVGVANASKTQAQER